MLNSDTITYNGKVYKCSDLECIYKKEGTFIDIKLAVPDIGIRMTEYDSNVIAIKTDTFKYKINEKTSITKKITFVKKRVNKAVEQRRRTWKPFGAAANEDNKSFSFPGEEVFMEYVNDKRLLDYNDNFLKKQSCKKSFSKSTSYKPKMSIISNVKDKNSFKINKTGYIPSSIKKKIDKNTGLKNFSIIIKNIPTNLERSQVEYELKKMFNEFGTIKKVTILMDKYEPTKIRDIAFIDFSFASEAISALKSTKRINIGCCILSKEMAKQK